MLTKTHIKQIKSIIANICEVKPEGIRLDEYTATGKEIDGEMEIKVLFTHNYTGYDGKVRIWFNPSDCRKCINAFPPKGEII